MEKYLFHWYDFKVYAVKKQANKLARIDK